MNDKKINKNSSSQFLNTDGGKTKSNAIEVPSITLPKGGGAIKGIDEKFTVNAVNGTASFSIPLPFSNARGASPALDLSYNSGAGNGAFGLGWALSLSSIKRKTDKGLPQYLDDIDSDTFLFSGAEDLVPEFKKETDGSFSTDTQGNYIIKEEPSADSNFTIRFYRPRIEGLFAQIERWSSKTSREIKWRVITKENVTTLFGWSKNSRICDPKDPGKIFEWLPEFVFDDKGNCSQYIYKKEDETGFDDTLLCNRNRLENDEITYTNLYLEKVLYGNKAPYYKKFIGPYPFESDYMFQTVFDYGEYETNTPYEKTNNWDARKDAFSDYRAGFEIRTTRLCSRVLLFHYFNLDELPGGSALIKSLNFQYGTCDKEGFTLLKSITACGYIKKPEPDGTYTYTYKNLPPTEFEYQKHKWNRDVITLPSEELVHAPSGIDEQQYQLIDLFNEGLPGILTEQANGWFYKHNLGDWNFEQGKLISTKLSFEQAKLVSPKPSFIGLGRQLQLMDLDADGGKQLVTLSTEPKGYFELTEEEEWQAFRTFKNIPNINIQDANIRMIDLNGDGKPEVLITEDNVFTWYESSGRKGFEGVHKTVKPFDEERGPHIVFADLKQTIFLADMSGDGMTDIVRIRNGEICYWPNLGYGRFGTKVAMDNAPVFDYPDLFNPAYLLLADIDGSGTTDIIYLGKNKFTCWMNLSGNSFSTVPFEMNAFPEVHSQAKITVVDLLGKGVSCIVWSSPLLKDAHASLKYIDLMSGKKSHIMVSYKNNFGKEVSIEYTPSTMFYIEDKKAGRPWVTKLHFPVQCISKIETRDVISDYRFVSTYKYHHGYYDHVEREFRGFGMVEQTDAEHFENYEKGDASNIVDRELHQEPVITKNWFHTGAFLDREKILHQYTHEYWYEEMKRQGFKEKNKYEQLLPDAKLIAAKGIDNSVVEHLSLEEWREALRACKGIVLRSEIFAEDSPENRERELTPYSASSHNCVIELLQPKGHNKHAVFIVKEREAITYNYERNIEDPRISHNINIKLDEYGNVLESASVVYPRLISETDNNFASLPEDTRKAQKHTYITYTKNSFTRDVIDDESYRLPMLSETKTYELKDGIKKVLTKENTINYYSVEDFKDVINESSDVAYHDIYKELDSLASNKKFQKRLIENVQTLFYNEDLTGPLPLGMMNSKGLVYENYQLAYTPELLQDIFGEKVNAYQIKALMEDGKFKHSIDDKGNTDDKWWVRSGIMKYVDSDTEEITTDAQDRCCLPISYIDPYGSETKVKYDDYLLYIKETEDALKNISKVERFNYRTLSPQRISDINDNISETIADELGLVKAMAVFGKGNEADDLGGITEDTASAGKTMTSDFFSITEDSDQLVYVGKNLLQHATARFIYDFGSKPVVVASILREEHYKKNKNSPVQISFEYSNGLGQVVMKKVQAEPGKAKKGTVNSDETITVEEIHTAPHLRWIGTGRTVLNNKGNVVKQYEPYFSVSPKFEDLKELVDTGVTPIFYYDAIGRLIKTDFPNGTYSKIEFNSWQQSFYDQNDTINKDSPWYDKRINHKIDKELSDSWKDPEKEANAAEKAFKHAETPNVQHFDTFGRPILSIEHNKDIATDESKYYKTKVKLDIEGNLLCIEDARGNQVMEYKYDMLGNKVFQKSMDAGKRWLLINVMGNPLRTWDQRDHEFQYFYDALHRPILGRIKCVNSSLDNIFDRIVYGETELNAEANNIRGKIVRHYDTGGLIETPKYDFKGSPEFTKRKLYKYYKTVANWVSDDASSSDLEDEVFEITTYTDALGRIKKQIMPDKSIITPNYNEAGLLNSETVTHMNINSSNTTTSTEITYIRNIDYNEKGQRSEITYGNDVTTKYYYDKETFRLNRLVSKRGNGEFLQDWYYTFDPVGNITCIKDKVNPAEFFKNQMVTGILEYTYDSIYRLREAKGRENNAAMSFGDCDNWNDAPFMHELKIGDSMGVWNYTEKYKYDEVGNIREIWHQGGNNNWTRNYYYEDINNRLKGTVVGRKIDSQNGEFYSYSYTHHQEHGYMIKMPHLDDMDWNFKEELVKTIRQKRTDGGTPETTYYQYDGQGQRIRKITENQANEGDIPSKKNERIYISGYELYRQHSGPDAGVERTSLSLMDKQHRFVMIDTETKHRAILGIPIGRTSPSKTVRYQLHNHLGSAALELDDTARVISYEEYHPYGTTAYQAKNAAIKCAAKRYRYTGMERDEESGLEYHGARYYVAWIGRWISCDPEGIKDSKSLYVFVKNNPILLTDPTGRQVPGLESSVFQKNKWHETMQFDKVDALVNLFSSDVFMTKDVPSDSAAERLERVLKATEHWFVPGLKTGGLVGGWHDEGFNKKIFKDPHESSDNQVGHFLTAVNLGANSNFVEKKSTIITAVSYIPYWFGLTPERLKTIRDILGVPKFISNSDLCIRLIVGHEKVADSKNPMNFKKQYNAATREDVEVFKRAEVALGTGQKLNLEAALKILQSDKGIAVDSRNQGNSYQDLLLSLVGWRLGRDITSGKIVNRKEVGEWIKTNLK